MGGYTRWLIVAVGAGVLVWWTWPDRATPPVVRAKHAAVSEAGGAPALPDRKVLAKAEAGLDTQRNPTAARPAVFTPEPLPPAGSNLATHYEALATRARSGDAKAALRLYHDLAGCERYGGAQQSLQWLRARVDDPDVNERRRARAERRITQYSRISCLEQQLCGGLSATQKADPTQWLVQAAVSGDADARIAFASGAFLSEGQLDALEYLPVYRAQARAMLEQGIAAGHPAALRLAAFGYGMNDSERSRLPLAQLLPYDPMRAQTYLQALQLALPPGTRMRGRGMPDSAAALTPAQQAEASTAARELYDRQLRQIGDLSAEMRRYREATMQYNDLPDAEQIAEMAPQCR